MDSPVVDQFTAEYFVLNRISVARQREVRKVLAALTEFAGKSSPEECDEQDLIDYMAFMLESGRHVNTVRHHNHAIRPFFHWAFQRRIVTAERWMRIRDVKDPRGSSANQKPRPYKAAEVREFWRLLDERWPLVPDKRLKRWRNDTCQYRRVWTHAMNLQSRAVISLAVFGGLRQNEIFTIGMADLHPDNEYIVVHGKTVVHDQPKVREVPYTEAGREMVAAWLEFRAWMKPKHEHPWLVVTANATTNPGRVAIARSEPNHRMKQQGFERIPAYVGRYNFHRFRHTFATEQLRAGTELETVSRVLGHASLAQTLVYAEIVKEDTARALRRSEPKFMAALGRAA